ncbi:hypothetical protein BN13_1080020 [Nostocoides jenkinsii Ben 74]|uniref:Uncharacterized protein n=1 Tax=Nostocoides jenkinsii Ben 74 TaxID=1193518 RepID=A0A077M9R2_9MICO|nr:hypothetical protein BN13_1080020 [Tetrasphaera jenkinsii Ben 74]
MSGSPGWTGSRARKTFSMSSIGLDRSGSVHPRLERSISPTCAEAAATAEVREHTAWMILGGHPDVRKIRNDLMIVAIQQGVVTCLPLLSLRLIYPPTALTSIRLRHCSRTSRQTHLP